MLLDDDAPYFEVWVGDDDWSDTQGFTEKQAQELLAFLDAHMREASRPATQPRFGL